MKRDPAALRDAEFDVVVVGAGIFGAWAALDAARRGLRVALVDKSDYGSGTSSHPYKIAHGGIRYVQHLDIVRVRHSCAERSALIRTAPHLVKPLPFVIPTYGRGRKGRWFLRTGTRIYDAMTRDRNRGIRDPDRRVPNCNSLDRDEIREKFPGVAPDGLTGGVRFYDGQIHSPPRLVWCVVRSAIEAGAVACNYVAASGIVTEGSRVTGVRLRDELDGAQFEVRTRSVLNTAGGWAERVLRATCGVEVTPSSAFSRDLCFVLNRPWPGGEALAVSGETSDPGAVLSRGARHLFLVPWRGRTLSGVWHSVRTEAPEDVDAAWSEIEEYLREVNRAYPGQEFTRADVSLVNYGLVLFGRNREGARDLRYGSRSRLIDHGREHGIKGLVTLIGVRFTTGRGDAAKAVRRICAALGEARADPPTHETPVWGGDVPSFRALVDIVAARGVPSSACAQLVHDHGNRIDEVLRDGNTAVVPDTSVLEAQVVHAARAEHAVHLDDALFRRTEIATAGDPGAAAIDGAAARMAEECGWSPSRAREEVDRVDRLLHRHLAR